MDDPGIVAQLNRLMKIHHCLVQFSVSYLRVRGRVELPQLRKRVLSRCEVVGCESLNPRLQKFAARLELDSTLRSREVRR